MPAFYCILLSKHSLFIKLSNCHAVIRLTDVTQVSARQDIFWLTGTPGYSQKIISLCFLRKSKVHTDTARMLLLFLIRVMMSILSP